MNRVRVTSSDIRSIGYDEATETLEIEFMSGGIYQYYAVPAIVFEGLTSAPSIGKFFHSNVRNGPYRFQRVG